MQFAMDLDEAHRSTVPREHRETTRTEMTTPEGMRVRRDGRNRRWTSAVRDAEAVNNVLRFDTWPHDDSELGQLRSDTGELDRKGALRVVEGRRLVEKRRAFGVKRSEFSRAVWNAAVSLRILGRRHTAPLGRQIGSGKH